MSTTASLESVHTVEEYVLPPWLGEVVVWEEPEGNLLVAGRAEANVVYDHLVVKTGCPIRAVAITREREVLIECETEAQLAAFATAISQCTQWEGKVVKIRCKGVGPSEKTKYAIISESKPSGRYYERPSPPPVSSGRHPVESDVPGHQPGAPGQPGEHPARALSPARILSQLSQVEKNALESLKEELTPLAPAHGAAGVPATPVVPSASTTVGSEVRTGKPPKFANFSGDVPIAKTEVSYDQWRYEVECARSSYSNVAIMEGIRHALRGQAADIARYLGTGAGVQEVLEKFDVIFGKVATCDTLMQDFYRLVQSKHERVAAFAARIEGALARIRQLHPTRLLADDVDGCLKDRLFHGLRKAHRDSIRYLYDSPGISYPQVLVAARKAESEGEENRVRVAALSPHLTGLEELAEGESVVGNVNEIPAQVRAGGSPEGAPNRLKCYRCKGFGHFRRDCPTAPSEQENSRGGWNKGESSPRRQTPQQ